MPKKKKGKSFTAKKKNVKKGPKTFNQAVSEKGKPVESAPVQKEVEIEKTVPEAEEEKVQLAEPVKKNEVIEEKQEEKQNPVEEAEEKAKEKTAVPTKIPQKQTLLDVPEMHNPYNYQSEDRQVDPNEKGSLTQAMNDMIRDSLGHSTVGAGRQETPSRQLGKNRLLEYLGEKGELLDGKGNRIPADVTHSEEETAKYFDKKLKDGESFFVYGKHDLYPHEISFDKETGALKCSQPLDHRPEKPGAEAGKQETQDYQRRAFAYEKFSHGPTLEKRIENDELLKQQKANINAIKAKNAEIEKQNRAVEKQWDQIQGKKLPQSEEAYDPKKPFEQTIDLQDSLKDNGLIKTSKAQKMTEQFALAIGQQMGYGDEFRKMGGGTFPLSQLAADGVIIAADGGNIEMSEAQKQESYAKEFGEKLLNGDSFYVRRKGEEFPRKVSYDQENNSIEIGEQMKKPPEEVPEPTRWQKFTNVFRKNKAVTAYNQYQKDKKAYDTVSNPSYQDKVKQTDPVFKAQAAEKARKERQQREEKRKQQELSTKEFNRREYGEDFGERVQRRAENMMADYEYNHPDKPLTEVGRRNIMELCSNYEKAKADLAKGNLKGKNGAATAKDLLAYELANKGINDPKANQMMSNVNNRYFSSNMGNLIKETADFKYMTREGHGADFFQKELGEQGNLEKNLDNVYKKATVMSRKADAEYMQKKQQQKGMSPKTSEGITKEMQEAMQKGDYAGLKKAMQAEEQRVQNSLKSPHELAKNFEVFNQNKQQKPVQSQPKAPVMQ